MILINEQWCEVRDLDDIVTIIKEQFNYDLGCKMSKLVSEEEICHDAEISDMDYTISSLDERCDLLEAENIELEEEINIKDLEIEKLNDYIDELKEEIDKLNDEIDYWVESARDE